MDHVTYRPDPNEPGIGLTLWLGDEAGFHHGGTLDQAAERAAAMGFTERTVRSDGATVWRSASG